MAYRVTLSAHLYVYPLTVAQCCTIIVIATISLACLFSEVNPPPLPPLVSDMSVMDLRSRKHNETFALEDTSPRRIGTF